MAPDAAITLPLAPVPARGAALTAAVSKRARHNKVNKSSASGLIS
jgi:hypothetical protein